MHNEHLFWESGSALVMGCCIDNCMVRHNKLKQVLLLKKKKEGERDHAFCKNINTYYFTFFAQLKKIPCPSTKKWLFQQYIKLVGKRPNANLFHINLLLKKGFFLTVASTLVFWEENLLYTNSDDAFLVIIDAPHTSIGTLHQRRALLQKVDCS